MHGFGYFTIPVLWRPSTLLAKLSNYLLSNRKRLGLSQDEVAFLLGTWSGTKTNRHERFVREPNLAAALAYQVIFQKPINALFGGLYEKIEKLVAERAKVLSHRIQYRKPNRQAVRKRPGF